MHPYREVVRPPSRGWASALAAPVLSIAVWIALALLLARVPPMWPSP